MFSVGVILFCFEIGFFLILVPWSTFWENNLLFVYAPQTREVLLGTFFRSAVTGLGALNCLIGISELRRCFTSYSPSPEDSQGSQGSQQ